MRDEIQAKAVNLAKTDNVLLLFSVRLGKTKTALDISKEFGNNNLIVTSEVLIIDTIRKEIDEWGYNQADYTIICYDSLHKHCNTTWDTIILDECEHITEKNYEYLATMSCKRWVGLCAKMSIDKRKLLRQLFPFTQYRVTYNEAIKKGILSEPAFYILNVYLDNVQRDYIFQRSLKKYAKNPVITCDFKDRFKSYKLQNNLDIRCTASEYYILLDEDIEYKKKTYFSTKNEALKNAWLQAGNKRKKWLADYKEKCAEQIIQDMRNRGVRFMVFSNSISQCERLGRGDGITHSLNSNDAAIDKFNDNSVDELYVVDRGKEGITIKGIEEGLIIQCSGSETANYQRAGRLGIAEKPVIYVLQVKGTRDEDYVNKLREDINEQYITEINYTQYADKFRIDRPN